MKAFLTKDKEGNVEITVKAKKDSDITNFAEMYLYRQMMDKIAEKFVEEYFTDIIKKVDAKTLAAFITVEAAKQAVNGRPQTNLKD